MDIQAKGTRIEAVFDDLLRFVKERLEKKDTPDPGRRVGVLLSRSTVGSGL